MDNPSTNLTNLRIFLSWSGPKSKKLAEIFKNYIEDVFSNSTVYMSAEDIQGGEKWRQSIENGLDNKDFSFIFLTPSNLKSKWIYFEAGALSKSMDNVRIQPFLYNIDPATIGEPLSAFQARKLDKHSIKKTFSELNNLLETNNKFKEENLTRTFERIWVNSMEQELQQVNDISDDISSDITDAEPLDEKSQISAMFQMVNEMKENLENPYSNIKQKTDNTGSNLENDILVKHSNPYRYIIKSETIADKIDKYSNNQKTNKRAQSLLQIIKNQTLTVNEAIKIKKSFEELEIPITQKDFTRFKIEDNT